MSREGIKPGTERNRTEPEVIVAQYVDTGYAIENLCYLSMNREMISRPVPATKHPADSLEPHQAYETL